MAARPGRVDVAVEIPLPDEDGRRRLFEVYTRGLDVELDEDQLASVVARTEGVTASFVKELVRRAVLESLTAGRPATAPLTWDVVSPALDDLLDAGQAVTRALLGADAGADRGSAGGRAAGGHGGAAWLGLSPGSAYGSSLVLHPDE